MPTRTGAKKCAWAATDALGWHPVSEVRQTQPHHGWRPRSGLRQAGNLPRVLEGQDVPADAYGKELEAVCSAQIRSNRMAQAHADALANRYRR